MTVYRMWARMPDGQYGNDGMLALAHAAAERHADKRPLLVTVNEHGGWWLQYYFDATHTALTVGTANDMARFGPEVQAVRDRLAMADVKVEYVREDAAA
jgi:hypothetical protein